MLKSVLSFVVVGLFATVGAFAGSITYYGVDPSGTLIVEKHPLKFKGKRTLKAVIEETLQGAKFKKVDKSGKKYLTRVGDLQAQSNKDGTRTLGFLIGVHQKDKGTPKSRRTRNTIFQPAAPDTVFKPATPAKYEVADSAEIVVQLTESKRSKKTNSWTHKRARTRTIR